MHLTLSAAISRVVCRGQVKAFHENFQGVADKADRTGDPCGEAQMVLHIKPSASCFSWIGSVFFQEDNLSGVFL